MPVRSDRPGLKRGRHRLPYWIARQVVREPMGFPDACIPLPADASDDELGELCRAHTARLIAWIEERASGAEPGIPRFDGSVLSACTCYQQHPHSPFHGVKRNTRKTYGDSLKVIEATVGKRLIRNLSVFDVKHWYAQWRKPKAEGLRERIDRAHDAVTMFRQVLRFTAAAYARTGGAHCKALADELAKLQFERGGAREAELTYAHATAFIRTALELGETGAMARERALYMAIGTAAQFELMLRQMDVIGEQLPTLKDAEIAARKARIDAIAIGEKWWIGYFTWERIPGWRWRMRTSKSKYRSPADFDLTRYSLLLPLLERVPHGERTGAIVKGEHGLPITYRSYQRWFRQIARAAGIPDEVWNMDSRAGGAGDADDSGAPIEAIRDALTHSDTNTTVRYLRHRRKKIDIVADARSARRAADEGGGDGSA